MIQEGKIELIMNQDPSSKAHLFYTVALVLVRTMSAKWRKNSLQQKNHLALS